MKPENLNATREAQANQPTSVNLRSPIPWWFFGGNGSHCQQLIDQSELPDSIKLLVQNVVDKSRLWPQEKSDVADELLGHFEDGILAGKSVEELVSHL